MYFWSNDDTLPATVVNDTGVYLSFVYDSIGCAVIDSFIVKYDTTLTDGNSKEVRVCPNTVNPLLADTGAQWYQWNTGATTQEILVADSGLYWVKSKKGNCIRIDTFVVRQLQVPPLFSSDQRNVCALQSEIINAYHPRYTHYQWSTGDTTPVVSVNQTGRYYVTASDSLCSITDSVDVLILNQVAETKDTGICVSGNIVLQSRPANTYLWSTSDTTSTLNVWQAGNYTVTRTIQQCQITDTFIVVNYPTPITTTSDTSICSGTPTVLKAQSASTYLWSTGDTAQIIQVSNAGQYSVITRIPPCQGTETFNVSALPLPQIVTVQDTSVCFDEVRQILLDAGQFAKYLWEPTGETTRTIYSNTAQVYRLTVTDSNTCVSSKEFAVMEECPYSLFIPNAFTPNNDGINDMLVIKGNRIDSFRMMVINRWGQIVFETNRMDDYWTGQGCSNDVYTLIIEYSALGKTRNYKGTVTLLR
jgi:gliding motility-associated-like protein